MRHSVAVKFIAVFLAALALFCAIGSGAGIIGLVAMDLYEESVEDLYNEAMQSTRQQFAVNLAHRYASLQLGKLPDQYLNEYYGLTWLYDTFQYGYFYYTIYNEHGNVVESTMEDAPAGGTCYQMAVTNIRFRALVEILPENWAETAEKEVSDSVSQSGTEDTEVTAAATLPPETTPETSPESASVPSTEAAAEPAVTEPAADPSEAASGETLPMEEGTEANETLPPTETPAADISGYSLETEPEYYHDSYFDYELEQFVDFVFTYKDLPPYTVELYLLPGAMPEEYAWTIVRDIWNYRYELFYVLGISLLVFAATIVYLCCAAGKKRGTKEVRPGGLNCIPLDLYALGGGGSICLAILLMMEVGEYLMRYAPQVLVPFVFFVSYLCCLLIVGFLFACAAQFKTSGGYWWRKSFCGYCLRLAFWLWKCFLKCCRWLWKRLPKVFTRSLRLVWRMVRAIWNFFVKCLFRCFGMIARFFGMLPLTWQWLLTGLIIMVVLAFCYSQRHFVICLAGVALVFGIILYGAHCFGILLENTKRMGRGDLETKVGDQLLIGSFREFAGDLNALADVAVVAAQKQLKSERMKTELITNVSHDIKTPLTSIINYVDLLQKAQTQEERDTYLEVLSRQSLQLKKLIEDLMEMSKASTGNMTVDITSLDACEAINQALGEFSDKLERAQLTPVFRQSEEPVYMKADGRLAWRVMSNLLSNAVKYAMPGTRLYIDLMELDGKVIISMKNISREPLNVSADELVERFVRGDASRNTEGSGLGLNIAQSLMELQKGQLQLLVDGDLFKVTLIFPGA